MPMESRPLATGVFVIAGVNINNMRIDCTVVKEKLSCAKLYSEIIVDIHLSHNC